MLNVDSLKQFTKEEIIYGIQHVCSEYEVKRLASAIEGKRMQDDYEKEQRLLRESNEAMTAYFDCMRELRNKYGDGKTLNLARVPLLELERAAELETAWKEKERQWEKFVKP